MDLLSPLSHCLGQASLLGLQTEVDFAVTLLSSITNHLSSRLKDESRKSVIMMEDSRKVEHIQETNVDELRGYNLRITNDDVYHTSDDTEKLQPKSYEEVNGMWTDNGTNIEYHDTDRVYGEKAQKQSVIMFGLKYSLDKTEEDEHDQQRIKYEDTNETYGESCFEGNLDNEILPNPFDFIARHHSGDIKREPTENRPSKSDEMIPTLTYGSTALTPKEQLFIQNCWTKLCELASSVPKVLGQSSLPCEFCDFKTMSRKNPMSALQLHRVDAHFLCGLCGARHATKPGLKKHFDKTHKRSSTYFVCGKENCTFKIAQDYNLRKLYYHIRIQHMDYMSACRVCKKTFEKLRNLKRHESEVHNTGTHSKGQKKICLHCGFLTKGSNMSAHVRNMHTVLPTKKCSICDFETRNGNIRLKKHMQLHLIEKVKCDLCNYSTRVKETLLTHKKQVHEKEEVFMCTSCNYKTPSQTNLSRHEQSHSNEKPYSCEQCNFKTTTNNYLKVHSLYHQDPKFLCDQCDYKSCSSGNLHTHKVVKHGTVKHECDQCGKLFNYNRHLRRHQANHEGAKMRCNMCDMQFYRKDKLKEHLSSIHQISEQESSILTSKLEDPPLQQRPTENNVNLPRIHICPDCPKTFTCSKHLSRHKNSVHSALELACQFCHKSFSRKDKLNIHTSFSCKLKVLT